MFHCDRCGKMNDTINQDIQAIKDRNARVEMDKAWETSFTRRAFITIVTYCFAALYMILAGFPNPFLGAFVPALGYVLSTISLPFVRKLWLKKLYRS